MAVLVNNLPAQPGTVNVSLSAAVGAGGDIGGTLTIDSETLPVISGAGTQNLVCDRGATPAAHIVGTSVSYSAGGGAGVTAATDRFLLTPSTPNFLSPTDAGAVVGSVTAGAYVGVLGLFPTAEWDQSGEVDISLVWADQTQGIGSFEIGNGSGVLSGVPTKSVAVLNDTTPDYANPNRPQLFYVPIDATVAVAMYPDSDPPTTGAVSLLLSVLTPAS